MAATIAHNVSVFEVFFNLFFLMLYRVQLPSVRSSSGASLNIKLIQPTATAMATETGKSHITSQHMFSGLFVCNSPEQ